MLVLIAFWGPAALAATPIQLPPGESLEDWGQILEMADLCSGDVVAGAPGISVSGGARWQIQVLDRAGEQHAFQTPAPRTADEREDLIWLAASLLDPLSSQDLPTLAEPALPSLAALATLPQPPSPAPPAPKASPTEPVARVAATPPAAEIAPEEAAIEETARPVPEAPLERVAGPIAAPRVPNVSAPAPVGAILSAGGAGQLRAGAAPDLALAIGGGWVEGSWRLQGDLRVGRARALTDLNAGSALTERSLSVSAAYGSLWWGGLSLQADRRIYSWQGAPIASGWAPGVALLAGRAFPLGPSGESAARLGVSAGADLVRTELFQGADPAGVLSPWSAGLQLQIQTALR